MLLEGHLQVAKRLHFVHERNEFRIVLCIEQVVFEYSEFTRVGKGVIIAVFFLEESVNLCGGEFMRIPPLYLSDDRVLRFDALAIGLSDQVATDDSLSHGHRA